MAIWIHWKENRKVEKSERLFSLPKKWDKITKTGLVATGYQIHKFSVAIIISDKVFEFKPKFKLCNMYCAVQNREWKVLIDKSVGKKRHLLFIKF